MHKAARGGIPVISPHRADILRGFQSTGYKYKTPVSFMVIDLFINFHGDVATLSENFSGMQFSYLWCQESFRARTAQLESNCNTYNYSLCVGERLKLVGHDLSRPPPVLAPIDPY